MPAGPFQYDMLSNIVGLMFGEYRRRGHNTPLSGTHPIVAVVKALRPTAKAVDCFHVISRYYANNHSREAEGPAVWRPQSSLFPASELRGIGFFAFSEFFTFHFTMEPTGAFPFALILTR